MAECEFLGPALTEASQSPIFGRVLHGIDQSTEPLDALGQTFPNGATEKFGTLLDELERWNRRVNLTAIRNRDEMIGGHLLDSLVARTLLEGKRVLDIGTGAGFPALPRVASTSR